MNRFVVGTLLALLVGANTAQGAELVRLVRYKIAAGDLATGIAAVEDYRKATGVDAEYLDAIGWLARGAEMLRKPELAGAYVAELRREIPQETQALLVPYGAAIEVHGRLLAATEGRGAAIRFYEGALADAKAPSLRSRIRKNINMLSLEGQLAPAVDTSDFIGVRAPSLTALKGKPVLLFFFAEGCGDCRAQAPSLARVWKKYGSRGVDLISVTRLYGGPADKPLTPADERALIQKNWKELYGGLEDVPVVLSTDTMVRYGASATPTFVLLDKKGYVRLYTPTRLSEAELSRKIDEVLAE
jgi:thiol-disulfide isomerase/thioredoxin